MRKEVQSLWGRDVVGGEPGSVAVESAILGQSG